MVLPHTSMEVVDFVLWIFLYYKLFLLLILSIPLEWFKGIKKSLIVWASKSRYVNLYFKMSPLTAISMTLFVYYHHHHHYFFYSNDSLENCSVSDVPSQEASSDSKQSVLSNETGNCNSGASRTNLDVDEFLYSTRLYLHVLNLLFLAFTRRIYEIIRGDPTPFFELEASGLMRSMIHYVPFSLKEFYWMFAVPLYLYPLDMRGTDNIPLEGKKVLFIGNHCIWALDIAHLIYGVYQETGIYLRGLAEHTHFYLPFLNSLAKSFGAFDGTRENCEIMMKAERPILIFPGGIREAFKIKKDKKYDVMWDHHYGFVNLAIKHGYTIVPFASVGVEDVYKILLDVPVGWLIRMGGKVKGMGGAHLKAPLVAPIPWEFQKTYIKFYPSISTKAYAGMEDDMEKQKELRDKIEASVRSGIEELLAIREKDPDRYTFKSMKHKRA